MTQNNYHRITRIINQLIHILTRTSEHIKSQNMRGKEEEEITKDHRQLWMSKFMTEEVAENLLDFKALVRLSFNEKMNHFQTIYYTIGNKFIARSKHAGKGKDHG